MGWAMAEWGQREWALNFGSCYGLNVKSLEVDIGGCNGWTPIIELGLYDSLVSGYFSLSYLEMGVPNKGWFTKGISYKEVL